MRPSDPRVRVVDVESGLDMLAATQEAFPSADIAVMCAAVADYRVASPADSKIKREAGAPPVLDLVKNPDIAATLGADKKPGQLLVGFALETDNGPSNALSKMERKNLDMIVLNSLRDAGAGFGTDTNKITLFTRDGSSLDFPLKSKREVAADIWDSVGNMLPC